MVEVLGLFVTLLGFLIRSGTVIIKAKTFSERAIAMSVVVVGALVFFALLRLVTHVRRRPSGTTFLYPHARRPSRSAVRHSLRTS